MKSLKYTVISGFLLFFVSARIGSENVERSKLSLMIYSILESLNPQSELI